MPKEKNFGRRTGVPNPGHGSDANAIAAGLTDRTRVAFGKFARQNCCRKNVAHQIRMQLIDKRKRHIRGLVLPFVEWAGNAQHCVPMLGQIFGNRDPQRPHQSRSVFPQFDTDNRSCHLIL